MSKTWLQVPVGLFSEEGKPINKGKMYISHTSPAAVAETYFQQFRKDFSLFLKSRSEELIRGGRMALVMLGRKTDDHHDQTTSFLWEVLAQSFALMVSKVSETLQFELDLLHIILTLICLTCRD